MDTLLEINSFYNQIIQYENIIKMWINSPSKENENKIQNLRTELQRYYPRLENQISYYGEYKPIADRIFGEKFDVFDIAFDSVDKSNAHGKLNAINDIKNIINKAIGKLEAEGETWPGIKEKITQFKTKKYKKRISAYQKVWRWIDTHRILSILGALAALATIIGVIYSIFFA